MSTPERPQVAPREGGEVDPNAETGQRVEDAQQAVEQGLRPEDVRPQWQEQRRGSEVMHTAHIRGSNYIIRVVSGQPTLYRLQNRSAIAVSNLDSLVGTGPGQMSADQLAGVRAQMEAVRPRPAVQTPPPQEAAPPAQENAEQPVAWLQRTDRGRVMHVTQMNGYEYAVALNRQNVPTVYRRAQGATQLMEVVPDVAALRGEGAGRLSERQLAAIQQKLGEIRPAQVQTPPATETRPEQTPAERPVTWSAVDIRGQQCQRTETLNGYVYIIRTVNERPVLYRTSGGRGSQRVQNVRELIGTGEGKLSETQAAAIEAKLNEMNDTPEARERIDTAADAFRRLEAITVLDGQLLNFTGSATETVGDRTVLRRNFFRTRNIMPDRMGDFVRYVERGARQLDAYVRRRSETWQTQNWRVNFDGQDCYTTCDAFTGRAIASPAGILRMGQDGSMQTEDGRGVRREEGRGGETVLTVNNSANSRIGERLRYRPGGLMSRDVYEGGYLSRIEFYDGRANRPNMIRSLREQTVALPTREGATETTNYTLRANKVYILGEDGPPHTDYQTETGDTAVIRQEGAQLTERRQNLERYAQQLARNLRTPEAVGAYIADILSDSDEHGHSSRNSSTIRWTDDGGYQDVQHPLETLFTGRGDCEDQAGAARYLLSLLNPPVRAEVINVTSNHFQCVYVEESRDDEGRPQYNYCRLEGGRGFYRSPRFYSTPGEAVRSSWDTRSGYTSSAQMDLAYLNGRDGYGGTRFERQLQAAPDEATRQQMREYYAQLQRIVENGGGVTTLAPPSFEQSMLTNIDGVSSNSAGHSQPVAYNDNEYWMSIVRFSEGSRPAAARPSNAPIQRQLAPPASSEVATQSPEQQRIAREQAKIAEARQGPRNQWRHLQSGDPRFHYQMDDTGNLFATSNVNDRSAGYYWLRPDDNYRWVQRQYTS